MYGASLSRIIIGSILGIPYIIYCAIMRCCITCILKDGTILRKFRFWKLIRSIVCAIILVTIITGRIFLWIGYFSFAEGSLESTTGISNQWFLIDNINEICRSVSGIYVFYGFKWVTRALSQLKRSDEFDGEYYSDNESKSEEDNKKKKEICEIKHKAEQQKREQNIMLRNIEQADKIDIEEHRRKKYGNFYDAYMKNFGQNGGNSENFNEQAIEDVYVGSEKIDDFENNSKYQIIF